MHDQRPNCFGKVAIPQSTFVNARDKAIITKGTGSQKRTRKNDVSAGAAGP